jgi:hypothetical protein
VQRDLRYLLPKRAEHESSSEMGQGNVDGACCGSSSATMVRGGSAALARAVRNASEGGCARHPTARGRVCSAPRTSPKMESERLVRRKERTARSTGQPAFSIARTVCSPAWAGSVLGSIMLRSNGLVRTWAPSRLNLWLVFGSQECCRGKVYPATPLE